MIRCLSRTLFHCHLHPPTTNPWLSYSTHIQDRIRVLLHAGSLISTPCPQPDSVARCLRHLRPHCMACTRDTGMKTSEEPAQGMLLMKRFPSSRMFVASTHEMCHVHLGLLTITRSTASCLLGLRHLTFAICLIKCMNILGSCPLSLFQVNLKLVESTALDTRHRHLPMMKKREKVKIYDGFLHDAESFLRKLYADPEAEPTYDGYRIFQTLFVMFGEGPRFGPVDTLTFQSIFKAIAFVAAIGNGRLYNLIKSWRNLSYTTLVLKLVLLEEAIVEERARVLDGKLDNRQHCRLVREVKKHRLLLANRFDSMFANAKELNTYPALRCEARRVPVQVDHLLGPFSIAIDAPSVRGQITLQQLTDKFLYLLRFEDQLVPGILARMDGYSDVLNLTTLSG